MLNGFRLFIILILFIIDLYPDQPHHWCIGQRDRLGCFDRGFETRLCQIKSLRIGTIYLRCPVQILVSGSSFKCFTIFAIFCLPYSKHYSSVNGKLIQKQNYAVLRAFALKMRKLPGLYDVGCFRKCRSSIFPICDGIFAIIINPWFTLVFWICGGLCNSLINY